MEHATTQSEGVVVDVDQVMAQHPDEWLLFEVLERDKDNHPVNGILLFHHPDREILFQHAIDLRDQIGEFYVVFTGNPIPEGMVAALCVHTSCPATPLS